MHHIRPHKVFALCDAPPSERIVQLQLPPRRAAGGVTLLEACLLITASKAVAAKRIFEFGTFLGSTTLNLALNLPTGGQILTLDLDEHNSGNVQQHPADAPLTESHIASICSLDFAGSVVSDRVKTLNGNSVTFDFSAWKDSIDLVFVDGGHDLATAKADTEHAMDMVAKQTPSCVMWHDYGNSDYPDLTDYLDQMSARSEIFHIEDTMLCVWFNDPSDSILPRLLP